MRYLKKIDQDYNIAGPVTPKPKIHDYVAVRETSPKYKISKNKIYQITLWNSAYYYLSDVFDLNNIDVGWIDWGEVRFLNKKELKRLDILKNVDKYNL